MQKKVFLVTSLLLLVFVLGFGLTVHATEDERRQIPVESNAIEGWPEGPVTGAKAALVMDADTGVILYAKNIHAKMYPASTTKMLTALVAIENAPLSDNVYVSAAAVNAVPADGSRIGLRAGDVISLEEALYAIMVGSANEAANAIAEHVGGSIDGFADQMNARAKELGALDSHFSNPNGLHEADHYTTAYDLALITRAYFDSVTLSSIGGCARYHMTPTATQQQNIYINNRHKMVTGEVAFDRVIGGKTGFTDEAGDCLVTCAERDGTRLISVVLFEQAPAQYTDTTALLEYGFQQFQKVSMAGLENTVLPRTPDYFLPASSLFQRPVDTLSFAPGSALSLPAGITPDDPALVVETSGTDENGNTLLSYTFHGADVGRISVLRTKTLPEGLTASGVTIRINLWVVLLWMLLILGIVAAVSCGIQGMYLHVTSRAYRQKRRLNRMKKESRKRLR